MNGTNRLKRTLGILFLALVAVLAGMSVRVSIDWLGIHGDARPDPEREALAEELAGTSDPFAIFVKIAKFVGPSVVSISGQSEAVTFFGERLTQQQAGTGIIASEDGHILTNYHVIANSDRLSVELQNSKRYRARVIGGDADADLAVLKIDAPEIRPAVFGDSDAVEVGQSVLAIGNAFELRGTVTHGIVSAKARPLRARTSAAQGIPILDDLIQTDAPINPGNSGGPLVDIHGRVIGVNTMIYSRSGTSAGVGFAIPINYAKQVFRQIVEKGHVVRGGIGITWNPRGPEAQSREGVRVEGVTPGSPADEAGIEPGDKIVELDGRQIRDFVELRSVVTKLEAGRKTSVKVQRGRRTVTLPITIGSYEQLRAEPR